MSSCPQYSFEDITKWKHNLTTIRRSLIDQYVEWSQNFLSIIYFMNIIVIFFINMKMCIWNSVAV